MHFLEDEARAAVSTALPSGQQIRAVTVLEAAPATATRGWSPSWEGEGASAAGLAAGAAGLGPAGEVLRTEVACTESPPEYEFPVLARTSANG